MTECTSKKLSAVLARDSAANESEFRRRRILGRFLIDIRRRLSLPLPGLVLVVAMAVYSFDEQRRPCRIAVGFIPLGPETADFVVAGTFEGDTAVGWSSGEHVLLPARRFVASVMVSAGLRANIAINK